MQKSFAPDGHTPAEGSDRTSAAGQTPPTPADRGNRLCNQLLKDAARLLGLDRQAWDEHGAFVRHGGLHHHLIAVDAPHGTAELDVACYMLRLPLRPVDPGWTAYLLELNLMLVPNTGLCIGSHPAIGLGLLCRFAGDELNPFTLADAMETAASTVSVLMQNHWRGELPR